MAPGRKELQANVTSVLSDEVDKRHAEEHRHRNGHPRRGGSRVTKLFPAVFLSTTAVVIFFHMGMRWRLVGRFLAGNLVVAHRNPADARTESDPLVEVMGFEPTASTLRT